MRLFNPISAPNKPPFETGIFDPGNTDFPKLTSAEAYQQYENLCNALVKIIIDMLRKPCTDYKALTIDILQTIALESKKIAATMGFQEKFCQLRQPPPVETQLKDIWTNTLQDDMKVKVTLLKSEAAHSVKINYIGRCYTKIAMAFREKKLTTIKQEPGLLQGTFPSGISRYTLKILSQTSMRFKHKKSGNEEEMPIMRAMLKYKKINPEQYIITPIYKHLDEAINDTVNGVFRDISMKDFLVGEIEILHNNIWLPLTRHLTVRCGESDDFMNEKMPCVLVRCELDVINPVLEMIAELLEKKLKLDSKNIDEIHNHTAAIIYLLEQSCPFLEANVHATRIFTAACYGAHDLKLVYSNALNDAFLAAMYAPWLDLYVKKTSAVLKASVEVKTKELLSTPSLQEKLNLTPH